MIGYRPSGGFAQRGLSTTVKIPRLWTSPFDRNVATTKLCVQNISILQFCRICIPAGLPGDQPLLAVFLCLRADLQSRFWFLL